MEKKEINPVTIDDEFGEVMLSNTGCAIIMAGSDSDEPHIRKIGDSLDEYQVPWRTIVMSAHKQPGVLEATIEGLNKVGGLYTIVAVAGGTDALSGTGSFHALAPVISCPPDTKYADKAKYAGVEANMSCLSNPPGSSNAYISRPGNVGRLVAQMYAGVNPTFRQILQEQIDAKVAKLETKGAELYERLRGR